MELRPNSIRAIGVLTFLLGTLFAEAQSRTIRGYVKDKLSDERIPFASLKFTRSQQGRLTDSSGAFSFHFDTWPNDTLEITYVGYQDVRIPISQDLVTRLSHDNGASIDLVIAMERGKVTSEVIVRKKIDRGYLMWKRIVKRKPFNHRYR